MCIDIDLENEKVSRTKRPRRCLSVQFHRSMCAVSPVSLPTCVSCSNAHDYPIRFPKICDSLALCDTRLEYYSTALDMFAHFDSPTARATTCRIFLQRAMHIHTLFTLFNTKDHSSSNSRIVADSSFGSGATNVSFKGGSCAAFF